MSEINPYKVNNGGMHIKEMDFHKKISIPDVDERTNNDPCYLMSSNDVLKLIKSMYPEGCDANGNDRESEYVKLTIILDYQTSGKEVITPYMVEGIIKESINRYRWSDVQLHGKQLLFIK